MKIYLYSAACIVLFFSAQALAAPKRPAAPPALAKNESGRQSESERLKQLRSITYDRRPSAILRAWSEPEPKKPAVDAKAKVSQGPVLDFELALLSRHVTLGRWAQVKEYWAGLPAEESKAGFAQLLRSLSSSYAEPRVLMAAPPVVAPPMATMAAPRIVSPSLAAQFRPQMAMPGIGMPMEGNVFSLDDVLGLIAACPHKIDKPMLSKLGTIVTQAVQLGTAPTDLSACLAQEAGRPPGQFPLSRRQGAQLLLAAGQGTEIQPFLPTLEQAKKGRDYEGLNLLAQMLIAQNARDGKLELLEQAWQTLQTTLTEAPPPKEVAPPAAVRPNVSLPSPAIVEMSEAAEEQPPPERTPYEEALLLASELAPRVRDQLGQAWMEASFTTEPQRGIRILATLGPLASQAVERQPRESEQRFKLLKLQKTAVEALLKSNPQRATEWRQTLEVLARAWLREGDFTCAAPPPSTLSPGYQDDGSGSYYYVSPDQVRMMHQRDAEQPQPIEAADLLEAGPSETWLATLQPSLRPRFQALYARLYLHASEPERAFPFLQQLAASHPTLSRELAHELIRAWTRDHNLNTERSMNPYMYLYGLNPKAQGIPLSRSSQQRNLGDLAKWAQRLRALPIADFDETLLATAFTTCHSSAEVYRQEGVESVFGPIDKLNPKTLAHILQSMRSGLTDTWRQPAEQEAKKTGRKQKDIEAEVLRGYEVARNLVDTALTSHPKEWRLQLVKACLQHDENAFRQEVRPTSQFSQERHQALAAFQKAAELYAQAVPALRDEEQSNDVYERWFYAGLGACDLSMIDDRATPDPGQPALVRAAILALPGETAKRHLERFAEKLFSQAGSVKPSVKFRYFSGGMEIVGDEKRAREARKQHEYYQDLVTEIQLKSRLDGSSNIDAEEPFGVFVELRHTPEIERESGGFAKYLTNQNSMLWGYNYGRPAQDYRDRFKESVNSLLAEQFEVLSITFQDEKAHSRPDSESGWRVTPYAYLLLKPRGPQVDKLPPLKLDLDFLDSAGYVVLPVQSAPIPLNCSATPKDSRPYANVQITQTLDERQAEDGKLVLEVKASARGLVPKIEALLDIRPEGFEIVKTEDQGLGVTRFDPDSNEIAVNSQRVWLVSLAGRQELAARAKSFAFPAAKADVAKMELMRYQDADLVKAESPVALEQRYGQTRWPWEWVVFGALGLVALGLIARLALRRKPAPEDTRPQVPEAVTPFNVLTILRNIHATNGLAAQEKDDLQESIVRIERFYFAGVGGDEPDLRTEAERWLSRTR